MSPKERRLRAGWRLLLQALLQIVFTVGAGCGVLIVSPEFMATGRYLTSPGGLALSELAQVVIITLSVFLARRLLDRRGFLSLGLVVNRQTATDVLVGLGITGVMMGLIYLGQWSLGWLSFEGFSWQFEPPTTMLLSVAVYGFTFLLVGFGEELLSRGYHLQTIASGTNVLWGLLVSSAIFGALHLGNPEATWMGAIGVFFAGLFLAYAFLRTGQLWLSIGLHIGWNFFEGVVFGFPVSGLTVYHMARISISGPAIWTGGAFGPEAGLVVLPALVLGTVLIHLYTRARTP